MTDPAALIEEINEQRTNILMAPPSVLRQLLPLSSRIKIPLRRIITYAEVPRAGNESPSGRRFPSPGR
jgi:non-ribosomal peptide synthetase component F